MGSAVCAAVALDPELDLVAAVDPYAAGQMIEGMAVSGEPKAFVDAGAEVVVDFSVADAARRTVLWLAMHGIHTVVGTTGLTDEDLETFAHEFRGDDAPNCAVVPNFDLGGADDALRRAGRRSSTRSRSSSCTTTPRPMRRPGRR